MSETYKIPRNTSSTISACLNSHEHGSDRNSCHEILNDGNSIVRAQSYVEYRDCLAQSVVNRLISSVREGVERVGATCSSNLFRCPSVERVQEDETNCRSCQSAKQHQRRQGICVTDFSAGERANSVDNLRSIEEDMIVGWKRLGRHRVDALFDRRMMLSQDDIEKLCKASF